MSIVRFFTALALSVLVLASAASAQTAPPDHLKRILASGVLRVGTTMDTPLFSMRNPSTGTLEGVDIDLMPSLAAALGVKIVYVKMTFTTMLGDIAADKFDVAMSGLGLIYPRARVAAFSHPYLSQGKLMIVKTSDAVKYHSIADLDKPGLKIAYNNGGLNDAFVHKTFHAATPTGYETNVLATADLLSGKVDAQAFDSVPARYYALKDPRLTVVDADHPRDPINIAMMLRPEDQTLINFVNVWVDQIKLDGTLDGVLKAWGGK
jgi:cyclohexadienyl dehydratase